MMGCYGLRVVIALMIMIFAEYRYLNKRDKLNDELNLNGCHLGANGSSSMLLHLKTEDFA